MFFKSILPCLILFVAVQSNAQTAISAGEKGKRLIEVLNKYHVKPRVLDSTFGQDVNRIVLETLDPEQIFFSREETKQLRILASGLGNEIQEEQESYLTALKSQWKESITRSSSVLQSYFDAPIQLNPVPAKDTVLFSDHPKAVDVKRKWELIFRNAVLSDVMDQLELCDYTCADDSLEQLVKSATELTRQGYDDYFNNLTSDASFLDQVYLNAIAKAFDPHSNYFSFSQTEQFKEELSSERELFGVSYFKNINGSFEVSHVVPGSSAWLSGDISVGDQLSKIKFGKGKTIDLKGKTQYELNQLFDKNEEDEATLTLIAADGTTKTVELFKTKVYSDEDIIKAAILEGEKRFGYISLPDFYTSWNDESGLGCANDLAKVLIKLKRENIEGVILDLRDNGGGSLKEAIDLTGIFINYGPILVVNDESDEPYSFKDFNRGAIYSGPLVVMINGNSASASEVVAGALQDYNRALIVGRNSFGKATGQSIYPVAPESVIVGSADYNDWGFVKATNLGLYRIDLSTNQVNGVEPDIELQLPYDYPSFRERDYFNPIHLDSIQKKLYFTTGKEIDVTTLSKISQERQTNAVYFAQLKSEFEKLEALFESFDPSLAGLEETIDFYKKELEVEKKIKKIFEEMETSYTAKSMSFDADVYKMNEYLNNYKEAFLEDVENDGEIEEVYHILLDYLDNE